MQNCFKKLMKEDNFDKIFGVFNFFHKCCGLEDSKTWRNFNHPYPSACCGFVNSEKNCTELEPSFQKEGCLLVYSRKLHNYINVLGSTCISSVILFVIAYIIYEEKIYTILKKPKTRNKEAANPI
ncbi:uncharacterized protein LOC129610972 isoform X2 [Condylostylus longicornis]|uniref:uncharacterized protein LOC129610972 isoform X2 n=1 Tax=Condylostylus longicornis TaxID=2530218 RepID=UPI00244DE844|nr:uncharacterized protein LOC129610972 isoform X2 [Condylostylus longicornis]